MHSQRRGSYDSRAGQLAAYGKETNMLWTIAAVLMVLWLLGLVSSYTMGGFVHLLLVAAVIVILFNIFQGRRLTSS